MDMNPHSAPAHQGYQRRLTLIIWLFAFVPALLLTIYHLNQSTESLKNMKRQEVVQYAQKNSIAVRNYIKEINASFDAFASEGHVIQSAVFDKADNTVTDLFDNYLQRHSDFLSIMLIDTELEKTAVLPSKEKSANLMVFANLFNHLFIDEDAYFNPGVHYKLERSDRIFTDTETTNVFLLAVARPILQGNNSVEKPFQINSILFALASLDEVINQVMNGNDNLHNEITLSIYDNDQQVYSQRTTGVDQNDFFHNEILTIGEYDNPLTLTMTYQRHIEISLASLLLMKQVELLTILAALLVLFVLVTLLTRRLAAPVIRLRQLTETISSHNFRSELILPEQQPEPYREFQIVNKLLVEMTSTINEKFKELKNINNALVRSTQAFESANVESRKHNELLHSLMQYSIILQHESDVANICSLTTEMIYRIHEKPTGLVIYRSSHRNGFKFLDKAPQSFLDIVETTHKTWLTEDELDLLTDDQNGFYIHKVFVNEECSGYLVLEGSEESDFKAHAISMFVSVLQSKIEQCTLNNKLEQLANTDSLTGLSNRLHFDSQYQHYQERFKITAIHFSILMIDINGLKPVNDNIGHSAGDALIKGIANLLKTTFRESDVIARTGGDEFTLLLEDTNSALCRLLVERLRLNSEGEELEFNGQKIPLNYSLGTATSDWDDTESLLDIADRRMYEAKAKYYATIGVKRRGG